MILKYKVLMFSFLLCMPLLMTTPNLGYIQSKNNNSSYQIPFTIPSSKVKYSSFVNHNRNEIDIYTVHQIDYQLNSFFILSNSTISAFSGTTSNDIMINTVSLIDPNSLISDYNYFISNNMRFLIVSASRPNPPFLCNFTIFNLSNNDSFSQLGNSSYIIASINSFSLSPNVYFSIYNMSTFLLIKYDLRTNSFSTVLKKTLVSHNGNFIISVRTIMLNNKFYISIATNTNSFMYIMSNQELIFNREFENITVTSFTPISDGLLLYSNMNNSYFRYSYITNTSTSFANQISSSPSNSNILMFSPYNNDSFLALYYDSFDLINKTSINNYERSVFYIVQSTDQSLQAITLSGNKYYLFAGLNENNRFEIFFSGINYSPSGFNNQSIYYIPTSTTVTNSTSKSPYSFITSSGFISSSSSIPINFLLFFIFIIVLIGVILVGSMKAYKSNQNSLRSETTSDFQGKQFYSEQRQIKQVIEPLRSSKNTHCVHCGATTEPNDIFCQNCGFQL